MRSSLVDFSTSLPSLGAMGTVPAGQRPASLLRQPGLVQLALDLTDLWLATVLEGVEELVAVVLGHLLENDTPRLVCMKAVPSPW